MTRFIVRSTVADVPPPASTTAVSAGPDLPGSVGGLGMTWDITGDEVPAALRAGSDVAALTPIASQHVPLDGKRVKRTLLLRVRPDAPAAQVKQLETALLAMPQHISTIRSWSLSRVEGSPQWTHAWEQEYADVEGLNGEYLLHPYHWTYVDRWFDPEVPGSIVEPALAHIFRWADGPVLK